MVEEHTLDAQLLGLGTVDELGADLLEGLDIARSERDADLVDFLRRSISRRFSPQLGAFVLGLRRSPSLLCCKTFSVAITTRGPVT